MDLDKKALVPLLTGILKGAQRVPTILLLNPSECLADLNLAQYSVLDSEPLQDLKGHLINLLSDLPYILTGTTKTFCFDLLNNILYSKKSDGYSGSDLRVALIEAFKLLYSQAIDPAIKTLLSTAVKIQEILYSGDDDKRTPKSIIQLYNCTWIHHELCKTLYIYKSSRNYLFKTFWDLSSLFGGSGSNPV